MVFRRHCLLIALGCVAGVLVTVLVYSVLPKYYRASATILQPPETAPAAEGSANPRFSEALVSNIRTNTELFFSILGSRRMKDDLIYRFDLYRAYNVRNMDEAREILEQRFRITLAQNKVISVEMVDRKPQKVADMVNYCVQNLDKLIKELAITTAKQNRVFIENRLEETTRFIEQLEAQLKSVQNKNKLVADKELDEITRAGGQLMQELLGKQLELEKQRQVLNEAAPEIMILKKEIADLKSSLANLLDSQDELSRILRELKIQEQVYGFLTTKLEEAKINETRDTPVVQVLDQAVVPDEVYRPDLKFLIVLVLSVIGGVGVLVIFFDVLRFLGTI